MIRGGQETTSEYQALCQCPLLKSEGVPIGPQRKKHDTVTGESLFDLTGYMKFRKFSGRLINILTLMHQFLLQRGEETLRHRVVPAIAFATHAAIDSMTTQR